MAKSSKRRCAKGSRRIGSRCVKVIKTSKPKTIKKRSPVKKSVKKGKQVEKKSRGCSRQSGPKYTKRNSPPYPANECCGTVMSGNDGNLYVSKSVGKHCRWVKYQ
jgi:hypothetical protein